MGRRRGKTLEETEEEPGGAGQHSLAVMRTSASSARSRSIFAGAGKESLTGNEDSGDRRQGQSLEEALGAPTQGQAAQSTFSKLAEPIIAMGLPRYLSFGCVANARHLVGRHSSSRHSRATVLANTPSSAALS